MSLNIVFKMIQASIVIVILLGGPINAKAIAITNSESDAKRFKRNYFKGTIMLTIVFIVLSVMSFIYQ